MKIKTSRFTGNTIYSSDCGNFSSMNPRAVEYWEETKPNINKMNRSSVLFWCNAGHLKGGFYNINHAH